MIKYSEVARIANDKHDFYVVVMRNGKYLPKFKSRAITVGWLYDIQQGKAWCPNQSDITSVRQVADAPRKDVLLRMLHAAY